MADGQAGSAPEASVESRLEAYFSPPKAEAPAEESQEVEAQQQAARMEMEMRITRRRT